MKKGGSKVYQRFFRLIIFILGFILVFASTGQTATVAKDKATLPPFTKWGETGFQKDVALDELRLVRENENTYESQLSALVRQSLAVESDLAANKIRARKIKAAITAAQEEIYENKILAENLRLERKDLLADLYILTSNPLYFISSLLDTDRFFILMHSKDENTIVVEEKIKKFLEIDASLADMANHEQSLLVKKRAYEDENIRLRQKAARIQAEIARRQGSFGIAGQPVNLEKYFSQLGKIVPRIDRDFIKWNSAAGPVFEFAGGGTEHGLGLSQYGARGLALRGGRYDEIVKHYYQGVSIGKVDKVNKVDKVAKVNKVRIGIVLGGQGGTLKIVAGSYKLGSLVLREGTYIRIDPSRVIIIRHNKVVKKLANKGTVKLSPLISESRIKVLYKKSYFNLYSGELRIIKKGSSLVTVNILPVEEYLKGVVVGEMPSSWPLEAIKAQALAARSYTYKHLRPSGLYDMDDTTAYQVYIGAYHREGSNLAVETTRGQVITYVGKIVNAYYFSTSGGYTENNENIWGGKPIPYLRGVASLYEEDSPWWSWFTKKYTASELSRVLASIGAGKIKKIAIVKRGVSGRVLLIKIYGKQGTKIVTGSRVKQLINANLGPEDELMRSTLFGVRSIK